MSLLYNECKLKNTSVADLIIRGQVIAPSAYYTIVDNERQWFALDQDLETLITSGDIVVNDGTNDYVAPDFTAADALEYLRLNYSANAVRVKDIRIDDSNKGEGHILSFKKDDPFGAFDPYKDRVQYLKLADVGGSGRAIELSISHNQSQPYMEALSLAYTTLAYVVFPGTGGAGTPAAVRGVIWSVNDSKESDYRLYDTTNLVVLAELLNNTNGDITAKDIPIVGAFPIAQATLAVQARKSSAQGSKAAIAAWEIFF